MNIRRKSPFTLRKYFASIPQLDCHPFGRWFIRFKAAAMANLLLGLDFGPISFGRELASGDSKISARSNFLDRSVPMRPIF
jgi:hypothetical protein